VFLRELGQSITVLKGTGAQIAARMAKLGVYSVANLILYYPRDYDDRTHFVPLASFARESRVRSLVEVLAHEWFGYGRMRTLKVTVRDETAAAVLVCFNRPFLENQLPVGARVVVTGKFAHRFGELQSSTFEIESLGPGGVPSSGILPVYPLTEGINQGQLRRIVKAALVEYASKVEEEMPLLQGDELEEAHEVTERTALAEIHDVLAALTPVQPDTHERNPLPHLDPTGWIVAMSFLSTLTEGLQSRLAATEKQLAELREQRTPLAEKASEIGAPPKKEKKD